MDYNMWQYRKDTSEYHNGSFPTNIKPFGKNLREHNFRLFSETLLGTISSRGNEVRLRGALAVRVTTRLRPGLRTQIPNTSFSKSRASYFHLEQFPSPVNSVDSDEEETPSLPDREAQVSVRGSGQHLKTAEGSGAGAGPLQGSRTAAARAVQPQPLTLLPFSDAALTLGLRPGLPDLLCHLDLPVTGQPPADRGDRPPSRCSWHHQLKIRHLWSDH